MTVYRWLAGPICGGLALLVGGCSPAAAPLPSAPAPAKKAAPAQVLPVVGLLTDYGWDDPYLAQMKGVMLSINPRLQLLDLLHTVNSFDVANGAFLLDEAAATFPAGTIFVAVVDPQVGSARRPLLIKTREGKYYTGPDNGLFSRVIRREGLEKAWLLDRPEYFRVGVLSSTFQGRDLFGPVAAHLAAGLPPGKLGTEVPGRSLVELREEEASLQGTTLATRVLRIDHFGNVVLNLPKESELSNKLHDGSLVKILVGKESFSGPMVRTYAEVEKGRLVLLFGGSDLLEIAVNQGSAAKLTKAQPGAPILLKP